MDNNKKKKGGDETATRMATDETGVRYVAVTSRLVGSVDFTPSALELLDGVTGFPHRKHPTETIRSYFGFAFVATSTRDDFYI